MKPRFNMKYISMALVTFFLLVVVKVSLASEQGAMYLCQQDSVVIRSGPDAGSLVMGFLNRNDSIVSLGEKSNWLKMNYEGKEGWVEKTFFSKAKRQTASYWYNAKTKVLHNSSCRWFGKTTKGLFTDEVIGRDCKICGGANRAIEAPMQDNSGYRYWINSESGVRHNSGCRWFGNTTHGYSTNERIGRACGICGG